MFGSQGGRVFGQVTRVLVPAIGVHDVWGDDVTLTLGVVLRRSTEHLAAKGVESPRVDAEHLLGHALGLQRIELYMHLDRPLAGDEVDRARTLVVRRGKREPLQYILGEWDFRRLTLALDRRALIPRPETELVVEHALGRIAALASPRVLDVGTGSGAIALAVASEHPGSRVTAIDVSSGALSLAAENAARLGLAIELLAHDLRNGLPHGPWDLIVANPPYVPHADLPSLAPEVREWEPAEALFGDGLHEVVARAAHDVLGPGGAIVFEVGDGQAHAVAAALRDGGYVDVSVSSDLAGQPRIVEAVWRG